MPLYNTRVRRYAPILLMAACRAEQAPPTIGAVTVPAVSIAPIPLPPPAPPYTPPPGTIQLAVIESQGTISANADAPPEWRYSSIIAQCHQPGAAAGHLILALEEVDDSGTVQVKRAIERVGVDDAKLACITDAINRGTPPKTLSGTLAGHSLSDGGWARGTGWAYVTLY